MSTLGSQLVLVTGVNGYLGAHVVDRLVQDGYRVRGTVRASKLASTKKNFSSYGDVVEIVVADDLVNGSFPEIFYGVQAVIHTAAPLLGREATAEAALNVSIEGSLNILKQAEKAGIRNFAFTGSIISYGDKFLYGDTTKISEDQWHPVTLEDVLNNPDVDLVTVYAAEKALAEKAVWEFVDKHPHIELASINPTSFMGPFAPGQKSPFDGETFSINRISTMKFFYQLIQPDADLFSLYMVDVRDVARSLVAALKAPPTAQVGRKRLLLSGEYHHAYELADLVRKERPQLAHRINKKVDSAPQFKEVIFNERFKEVLNFELTPWEKSVLDGVDALVAIEDYWKARGKPIDA